MAVHIQQDRTTAVHANMLWYGGSYPTRQDNNCACQHAGGMVVHIQQDRTTAVHANMPVVWRFISNKTGQQLCMLPECQR